MTEFERLAESLSQSASKPAMDALRQLATSQGITITAALGQAISQAKYLRDAVDREEKLLIEDKAGRFRQVILSPYLMR